MADTLDVLTIAEARTAVGLGSDTSKDTVLAAWVTAVSRQLDQLCGPIVKRTVTDELHDGGSYSIRLNRRPVYSITTISEYTNTTAQALTAETNATKTAYNFLHDGTTGTLNSGVILRRNSNSDANWTAGRRNVAVTYEAGRAADTASVDAKFKQAASMLLRTAWVGEQASGTQTFNDVGFDPTTALLGPRLLNRVAALLDGEMLDGVYVG